MRRAVLVVAVALAVLAACGGGDDSTDESTGSPPRASSAAVSTTNAVPASATEGTEAAATTGATKPTASPPTSPPTTPTTPSTIVEGVVPHTATITVLTEGSGLGARPVLAWEPVADAASYVVSVNAEGGGPWWAWQGATTQVPFGAGSVDDPDTTGAHLTGPATWFVAALDADGRVVATSRPSPLAP